jgi:hypothetical protein
MHRKGNCGRLFLFILVAGLALSGTLAVTGYTQENTSDLDVIVIDNEGYDTDRKGPVIFSHRKHALDYEVSCWECHHEYDGEENVWRPWNETLKCSECHMPSMDMEEIVNLQKAYHVNCKNCHEEGAKKKDNPGPYRRCYGCHEKDQ